MYLRELRYILAIADEANITKAAERLYISQPSLSQFLSEYEKTLGFELFIRSRTGATPSPAGELFLRAARGAISQIDTVVEEITDSANNTSNIVRIGIPDQRAVNLTSYLIPHLRNVAPTIDFEVIEGINNSLRTMLSSGEIDLWVTSTLSQKSPYPELKHRILCTEEILLAIPPEHPILPKLHYGRSGNAFIHIKDLQGYDFFLCSKERNIRLFSDQLFARFRIKINVSHSSTNIATTLNGCQHFGSLSFASRDYTRLNPGLTYVSLGSKGYYWYIMLFTNEKTDFSICETVAKAVQRYFDALHNGESP